METGLKLESEAGRGNALVLFDQNSYLHKELRTAYPEPHKYYNTIT